LTVGMRGVFSRGDITPGDESRALNVQVLRIIPPERPDGSILAACVVDSPAGTTRPATPNLHLGESGTLVLSGKPRQVIEIPTAALIMSAGKWWVMVSGHDGEKPRPVEIGDQDQANTVIQKGVSAGESVVVTDAYLRFNLDFARHYQQPD